MRIDDQVEPRVREALAAVVKRDSPRFEAALRVFDDTGSLQQGVELAAMIVTVVLVEAFGGKPTEAQLRQLSATVAEMEQWLDPDPGEIERFLDAVMNGNPLGDVLEADQIVILPFLVAGSVLAARSKAEDGKRWFNYLDQVEAAIERAG